MTIDHARTVYKWCKALQGEPGDKWDKLAGAITLAFGKSDFVPDAQTIRELDWLIGVNKSGVPYGDETIEVLQAAKAAAERMINNAGK